MTYAVPADLEFFAEFYAVDLPPAAHREQLLERATHDVQRYLGAAWTTDDVDDEQAAALRVATCAQVFFRVAQGAEAALGVDDGLSAIGPLSFSRFAPARFSPEAAEVLSDRGLYLKSGTVPPELPHAPA